MDSSRRRRIMHASFSAPPCRSAPVDAPDELAFGMTSVELGATSTSSSGTPRASAASWASLVLTPWPISTAPVCTRTLPSLAYTAT